MEIRPILLSLKHNKAIAILIIIQVALTLGVLSMSILMTMGTLKEWNLPSGIPHENIISVEPEFYDNSIDVRQSVIDDIERIKQLDGVIDITPVSEKPFAPQQVVSVYLESDEEAQAFQTNIFDSNVAGPRVLDLKLISGRFFTENEVLFGSANELKQPTSVVMISEQMAEALFNDGPAVGKTLWLEKGAKPASIIGVYSNFMNSEQLNRQGQSYRTVLRPQVTWANNVDPNYLIRVEPGLAPSMLDTISNVFYKTPGRYLNRVEVLTRTQKRMYDGRGSRALIFLVISAVLVLITAFGMSGLVSFLVTQRKKQIGTRRALGASKWHVVRYFLLENAIVTFIGLVIGMLISLFLVLDITQNSGTDFLEVGYIFATAFFLLVVNLVAVYLPARRAANIAPAIVTRSA
ncbi:MAG: ABC transporter permease [Alteromonadaceae bacterium]|nr:ABC transporter permease [Alteromonadaceae bacterium]